MMTRLKKAGHCAPDSSVRWDHCGPILLKRSQQEAQRELRHGAKRNSIEQHSSGFGMDAGCWAARGADVESPLSASDGS